MKKTIIFLIILVTLAIIVAFGLFISVYVNDRYGNTHDSIPVVDASKRFSIVVLPDTQNYSLKYPEIFCKQTEWIVANRERLNIVFVSHMGDIVNDGAKNKSEWESASRCMNKLDGIVPYSVIPGNHDADKASDVSSGFTSFEKYFGTAKFANYSWYKGNFEGNRNNYEIITANEHKILFMNMGIEPDDKTIAWANSILKNNTDAYGIVTTHKYLPIGASVPEDVLAYSKNGNTGKGIWDKLIFNNCSVGMVWSGHFHGENRITDINSCGKKVEEIMQDYQTRDNGGDGWLRIYIFNSEEEKIDVYTYSPYLNQFEDDIGSRFMFKGYMFKGSP